MTTRQLCRPAHRPLGTGTAVGGDDDGHRLADEPEQLGRFRVIDPQPGLDRRRRPLVLVAGLQRLERLQLQLVGAGGAVSARLLT